MKLKEALDTLRPFIAAMHTAMKYQDELDQLEARLRDAKYAIDSKQRVSDELIVLKQKAAEADAERTSAQRATQKLRADTDAEVKKLLTTAKAEAQVIIDQHVAEGHRNLEGVRTEIENKIRRSRELDVEIEGKLQKHKEIADSIAALKASL